MSAKRFFVFLAIANFILFWSTVLSNPLKYPARVLVIQDRSVEDGYKVEIESNGEKKELQLSLLENLWSDDAQALHIKRNEKGEKVFERIDIPKDLKVYHDQKKGAILSIREGKINGILDSDFMIKSEGGDHFIQRSTFNVEKFNKLDYEEIDNFPKTIRENEHSFQKYDNKFNYRARITYVPEVTVILDSKLSNLLGSDSKIYEYLTIFWNAVKKRFNTINSPRIIIRLVGCVIIRNSQDEPFLTNNKNEEGLVDSNKAINDAGDWIYQNMETIPDYDLIYVQTGEEFVSVTGRAFIGAVCIKSIGTRSYAVSMGEDLNGFYFGVHTATHEVAHTLGSPHDPKTNDANNECDWDKGYIMSNEFGALNDLFFSQCSIDSMAEKLKTSRASCTKQRISQTKPAGVFTSSKLPGDVLTMDEQCKQIMKDERAKVYTDVKSENELCYDMKCIVTTSTNYTIVNTNRGAAEGSRCPSRGHCHDGQCIEHKILF